MRDSRFIELVNLYVDRQISPAEAAELEAELQASARRRQVYQQYCRMHRATKLVYESFRHEAGAGNGAVPDRAGAIARFESRQRARRNRWIYAAGGLAAAACAAFVFLRQVPSAPTADPSVPAVLAQVSAPVQPAAPVVQADASKVNLVSLRNPLVLEADYQAMLAAVRREEQQRLVATGQLLTAPRQPASLFDDGVFDSRQVIPERDQRIYRGQRGAPNQPPVEFAAFQFQR